jgi:Protein of unknown function (DUF4065)
MPSQFEFQPEKSLAVTSYLASRSGETMYTILKMIYVADRFHLERYGRPITGDRFIAMEQGACPSKIYDSMKNLRGQKEKTNHLPNSDKYLSVDATTHDVSVLDMPSMDVLSASDIECLDEVISILKRRGRFAIRDMAHDKAWGQTELNKPIDILTIAKSLKDGDTVAKHLETRFLDA